MRLCGRGWGTGEREWQGELGKGKEVQPRGRGSAGEGRFDVVVG